jgi:tellurite resistance protein TehA-like permease
MNTKRSQLKLPAVLTAGSFLILFLLGSLTNPLNNAGWSLALFVFLFIFLVNLGRLILYLQNGELGPKARHRIVIISLLIVVVLMFSSLQALNWVDGLVLLLIGFGVAFYSSRRSF